MLTGGFGLAALTRNTIAKPASTTHRRTTLCEVYVAGVQHHTWYQHGMQQPLEVGSILSMQHEPSNPVDTMAIGLYAPDGTKVGFVPRWVNHVPANLLQQDARLTCTVTKYNAHETNAPWHLIKVTITLTS